MWKTVTSGRRDALTAKVRRHALGALLCALSTGLNAASLDVLAGDRVLLDGEPVALADIDAPELCQPGGSDARQVLENLLDSHQLTFEVVGVDASGHRSIRLYADRREVNQNLVQLGWAWDVTHATPSRYAFAEQIARAERIGLWRHDAPVPPWAWREREGRCEA